ncbi:MAG: class I SAM-dependent methyltransferase [Caldilineaceae bacterium]
MQQNIYDDPEFYTQYSKMARSIGGLKSAGEWPVFQRLLPDLQGKRVLDLGCGYGWHCRYAVDQGAQAVVGVDLSEKMLAQAKAINGDPAITYQRAAIEEIDFPAQSFDAVLSSLAFHYVERFDLVARKVYEVLAPGGAFVFSAEHPIFTARAGQDWHYGEDGSRLHWPVDNYQQEGIRHSNWLADDVIKYHRTVESYVNTVIDAGFRLDRLAEPAPSPEALAEHPEWIDEVRRPIFLLIAAARQSE